MKMFEKSILLISFSHADFFKIKKFPKTKIMIIRFQIYVNMHFACINHLLIDVLEKLSALKSNHLPN